MSQSLASIKVHVVFSTKARFPFLTDEVRSECHLYLAGVAQKYDCRVFEIGGMPDHVHVLLTLPRVLTLAKLMEMLKTSSSKWMKTRGEFWRNFSWQDGYGAFSVSASKVGAVRRYIQEQELHHRRSSFQDELRAFLSNSGVQFDEKYLWD